VIEITPECEARESAGTQTRAKAGFVAAAAMDCGGGLPARPLDLGEGSAERELFFVV